MPGMSPYQEELRQRADFLSFPLAWQISPEHYKIGPDSEREALLRRIPDWRYHRNKTGR